MHLQLRSQRYRLRLAAIRRLVTDCRGASAVEFALIAPLMITLYLGGVEITQAVAIDRKTTLVAHTVADLVAQETNITNADMSDDLNASAAITSPYSTTKLTVTVSRVDIDANGHASVNWSDTLNGTARAVGSSVTLPSALAVANTTIIWGETTYTYQPMFGTVIKQTLTLGDQIYMRPRISAPTRSAT